MHVLIINTQIHRSQFLRKAFRYENIGADTCHPENLLKIWYGQYDALVVPLKTTGRSQFSELLNFFEKSGPIPTLLTGIKEPCELILKELNEKAPTAFVASHEPFHKLCDQLKAHILKARSVREPLQILIGDLQINLETREVLRREKKLRLKNREFSLLECLLRNAGKVLTRTYLLENVWDRNIHLLSNTVDVHISRLRRKIDRGFHKKLIETVPCVGYRLVKE